MLAYDELQCTPVLMHPVPRTRASVVDNLVGPPAWTQRPVEETDVLIILEYLQRRGLTSLSSAIVHDVVGMRARESRFRPVRDYIVALAWDSQPRLDEWLSTYLGAKSSPYTSKSLCGITLMSCLTFVPSTGWTQAAHRLGLSG
jgi:predicted P-loop ATPase